MTIYRLPESFVPSVRASLAYVRLNIGAQAG